MKKLVVVFMVLLFVVPAFAMGNRDYNINKFGSKDNQRKHQQEYTVQVDPDRPVQPVPEPSTILLLGSGLVGLAVWIRRRK